MTTVDPIDVDQSETAVLIDYENIRLSWEKVYQRLFQYSDLCWLCELAAQRFRTSIGRVVVFMSDPQECADLCHPTQLAEMQHALAYLQEDQARTASAARRRESLRRSKNRQSASRATAAAASSGPRRKRLKLDNTFTASSVVDIESSSGEEEEEEDGEVEEKRKSDPPKEEKQKPLIVQPLSVESDDSSKSPSTCSSATVTAAEEGLSPVSDAEDEVETKEDEEEKKRGDKKTDYQEVRLGSPTCCPDAEVIVKVFRYKFQKRVRVQKCCDVVIGSEVTKICFMPRYNGIILFSADGDFEETTRACAEMEDLGGVIKFAKPIRILGFSHAFERKTANKARAAFYQRHREKNGVLGFQTDDCSAGASAYLIDYEFPAIGKVLRSSNRPMLPRVPPPPSPHGGPAKKSQRPRAPPQSAATASEPALSLPSQTLTTSSLNHLRSASEPGKEGSKSVPPWKAKHNNCGWFSDPSPYVAFADDRSTMRQQQARLVTTVEDFTSFYDTPRSAPIYYSIDAVGVAASASPQRALSCSSSSSAPLVDPKPLRPHQQQQHHSYFSEATTENPLLLTDNDDDVRLIHSPLSKRAPPWYSDNSSVTSCSSGRQCRFEEVGVVSSSPSFNRSTLSVNR